MVYVWTLVWLLLVLVALGVVVLVRDRMTPEQTARVAVDIAAVGIVVTILLLVWEPVR